MRSTSWRTSLGQFRSCNLRWKKEKGSNFRGSGSVFHHVLGGFISLSLFTFSSSSPPFSKIFSKGLKQGKKRNRNRKSIEKSVMLSFDDGALARLVRVIGSF